MRNNRSPFHPLVIANGHLHDASADLGHYIDGIGIDIGVIGLRRGLQLPDNEDQRQDGGKDQRQQRPLLRNREVREVVISDQ